MDLLVIIITLIFHVLVGDLVGPMDCWSKCARPAAPLDPKKCTYKICNTISHPQVIYSALILVFY